MTDNVVNAADVAAKMIQDEVAAIRQKTCKNGRDRAAAYLAGEIGGMLLKFVYQSEDFAAAVAERKGSLHECASNVVKDNWEKGISDVEAYAAAVKYYMPGATVRASFRVDAPREEDDDLFDIQVPLEKEAGETPHKTAIILDLFDGGEV